MSTGIAALDDVKQRVEQAVDRLADELERLSHRIHANPELAFKEEKAAAWLTEFLAAHGAKVERGVGGLPTAFRATIDGQGAGPTIAIMAEYDALPNIGHACGHNVIATAGSGAGAAIAAALGTLPFNGRIQVIGTPAEEGGAGKVKLMEAGVFKGVDAAMMIHGRGGTQIWRPTLGIVKVKCEFFGKAAHASSWPWRGVNALNAMIQLFVSLDQMRQQVRPEARIHGVITKGGEQANIIPEHTAAEFYLRAPTREYCQELLRRFEACAEGAATATGCTVTVTADPIIHDPLKPNFTMAALFEKNLARIDFPVDPDDGEAGYGSTDCGNVSQALPTIHPYIRISPDGVPGHSREFADWAKSPLARTGLVAGAKALAMTALDLLAHPDRLEQAKQEFAGGGHGSGRS
ncbi:MAG TPA: M20 family metallopeptidase [Methylomirabilota bacterium]|nr:M20 family metallopeptidase [Methylomirabilota bacterium]